VTRVVLFDLDGTLTDPRVGIVRCLRHALERLARLCPPDALYRAAVIAARANGLRSIGALWGYGSRDELLDAGADALCATPAELPACLARLTGEA
jgi:phosphoglycolate phosphatase